MAKLTEEMKDMIASQQCFHATVSKGGVPNNAPKRSTRVLDDETLIFNEGVGRTTFQNILDGSLDAVAGYEYPVVPVLKKCLMVWLMYDVIKPIQLR